MSGQVKNRPPVRTMSIPYGARGTLDVPVVLVRCSCGRSICDVLRYPETFAIGKGAENVSTSEREAARFGSRRRFTCPGARCHKRFMFADRDFVKLLDAALGRFEREVRFKAA